MTLFVDELRTTHVRVVPTALFVFLVYAAMVPMHVALAPVFNPSLCLASRECGPFAGNSTLAEVVVIATMLLLVAAIFFYVRGLLSSRMPDNLRQASGHTLTAVALAAAALLLNAYVIIVP